MFCCDIKICKKRDKLSNFNLRATSGTKIGKQLQVITLVLHMGALITDLIRNRIFVRRSFRGKLPSQAFRRLFKLMCHLIELEAGNVNKFCTEKPKLITE